MSKQNKADVLCVCYSLFLVSMNKQFVFIRNEKFSFALKYYKNKRCFPRKTPFICIIKYVKNSLYTKLITP